MKRLLAAAAALAATQAAAAPPKLETAVLAGGCFWGTEAVFEHVKGVASVVSGYAGGAKADATYAKVSGESTGHAEAIRISYDPQLVSYSDLLRIFFTVAHDPTQLNRQGPDVGPSYRSAVFPQNAGQRAAAQRFIAALSASKAYKRPIVTRIENGAFYPAEAYHQDFMRRNPRHPYILAHDVPKLAALKRVFPASYR
jgi:peptide-methionine (S)-S-oxide reductase